MLRPVFAAKQSAPHRAPCNDAEAIGARHGNQFPLHPAIEKIIGRLLADETVQAQFTADHKRLHHLPGGESAGTDIADLASPDQVVEGAQGFINRNIRLRPMDLVKINPVCVQAAQTCFTLFNDMTATVAESIGIFVIHGHIHLGSEDDTVPGAAFSKGFPGYFFTVSTPVGIGGVKKVNSGIQGTGNDGFGFGGFGTGTEHHAAQAERTDAYTGAAKRAVMNRHFKVLEVLRLRKSQECWL